MAGDPLDDNPPHLDERDEISEFIEGKGINAMNIRSQQETLLANALLEGMAEGTVEPGQRSRRDIALEHERVRSRGMDLGLDIGPVPEADIEDLEWL